MIHSHLLRVSKLIISTWIDRRIWMNILFFYWAVSFFVLRFSFLTLIKFCSVLVLFVCFVIYVISFCFFVDERVMRSSVVGKEVLGCVDDLMFLFFFFSYIWMFPYVFFPSFFSFFSFLSLSRCMGFSVHIAGTFPFIHSCVGFFHFSIYIYMLTSHERGD